MNAVARSTLQHSVSSGAVRQRQTGKNWVRRGNSPTPKRRKLSILISSAGRRVSLIGCFRQSAAELGLDLEVVVCDAEPAMSAACQLADHAFTVPRCDDPTFPDALLEIVRRHRVALVVPTIDPELAPLSAASDRFAALEARVHVSPPNVVGIARDKLKTSRALERAGVSVPLTWAADEVLDSPEVTSLPWPVILKPAAGSASHGIRVVSSAAELPERQREPMVIQQLLKGPEYTVNIFVDRHGVLQSVVPHRRLRVRGGEVEKGRTERRADAVEIARGVVRALPGVRGALCFQLVDDAMAGPRVFEINARFGGGYPLAHHAGAPFTKWLLEEVAGLPPSTNEAWREGVVMLRYDDAVFQG